MRSSFRDIHERMRMLADRKASIEKLRQGAVPGVQTATEHFRDRPSPAARAESDAALPTGLDQLDRTNWLRGARGSTIYRRLQFCPDHSEAFGPRFRERPRGLDAHVLQSMATAREPVTDLRVEDICFLDTETTGLAGGTGTVAFLIALGWWQEGVFELEQYLISDFCHEPDQLERVIQRLSGFRAICTYNGRQFDVPLLRTRAVLNRMRSPVFELAQIDLLTFSRRLWRGTLESVSLKNVERHGLLLDRGADISGAEAPELFAEAARTGSVACLAPVLHHNSQDVVSLAALLPLLAEVVANPLDNSIVSAPTEWAAIGRWMERERRWEDAATAWERALEGSDRRDRQLEEELLRRLALTNKRRGAWDAAVATWEEVARKPIAQSHAAWCELAKHRERVARDHAGALELVRRGLRKVRLEEEMAALTGSPHREMLQRFRTDFQKREERLIGRLARASHQPSAVRNIESPGSYGSSETPTFDSKVAAISAPGPV